MFGNSHGWLHLDSAVTVKLVVKNRGLGRPDSWETRLDDVIGKTNLSPGFGATKRSPSSRAGGLSKEPVHNAENSDYFAHLCFKQLNNLYYKLPTRLCVWSALWNVQFSLLVDPPLQGLNDDSSPPDPVLQLQSIRVLLTVTVSDTTDSMMRVSKL